MHQSFVTTASPQPLSRTHGLVNVLWRKCRGLIDLDKHDSAVGRTVMVLPASCPHSVVVTIGNCRHKVTVLDIPLGWCVVTND